MSVLIKGMEMPDSCQECWIPCEVPFQDRNILSRSSSCPAVYIPTPHGRLIDADALQVDMMEMVSLGIYGEEDCIDAVIEAPTIIPADPADKEGEG